MLEVWSVSLNISKTFDNVLHKGESSNWNKMVFLVTCWTFQGSFKIIGNKYLFLLPRCLFGLVLMQEFDYIRSNFVPYINDIFENFSSNIKLFFDDTFLFSVIHDINVSAGVLNEDLKRISDGRTDRRLGRKISDWHFQWKIILLQMLKQAQEVIFSQKLKKPHLFSSGFQQCYCFSNNLTKTLGSFPRLKVDN